MPIRVLTSYSFSTTSLEFLFRVSVGLLELLPIVRPFVTVSIRSVQLESTAMANSAANLATHLEQLVGQLGDAVQQFKTASTGGNDFGLRMNVITTAQRIAETAKKPEELWHDQSVFVRICDCFGLV